MDDPVQRSLIATLDKMELSGYPGLRIRHKGGPLYDVANQRINLRLAGGVLLGKQFFTKLLNT